VLLGQVEQLLQAAYTCTGRYAYGNLIKNCISLAAFGATMLAVCLHQDARVTALAFAAANMGGTVLLAGMVRRDVPWIKFGWQRASVSEIRRLSGPAIAFMGFPIGNALNIQGSLLAVGYALGPTEVVIFGTSRTVSRIALQVIQMVNTTFWPELSSAYGAGDWALVRALHRRACQMALAIALVIVTTMITSGPWLLTHWTGGHVASDRTLLSILLLVVVFNALWSTSSTLVVAMNRHQKLALYYIFGTSVTIVVTYIAAVRIGLYGVAASLLISELVMNLYVLPNSLRVSQDTFPSFFASLFRLPSQLRWKRP
jgi:O-antigen/teichoic acid export membrane protein